MGKRTSNKKAKQMICSVLNRKGHNFGYYSLHENVVTDKGFYKYHEKKIIPNSHKLREHGKPWSLKKASHFIVVKDEKL